VDEAVTLGNPLYTLLAPISEVQHFDPLTLDRLRMWIARQAESRGAAVAPAAVALLADLVGPDLWALSGELDKLSLYAGKRSITEEDVARLVSATKEVKIFAVVDAIVERNQSLALRRLETMIAQEDVSPFQVLSMLARQARLMLLCQEMFQRGTAQQELGKRLGLTGYPLQKTQEQARRYTWQQLLWLHGKLLETDVAVKTGVMEEIVALEVLIAEVCAPARPLAPAGPARGPG
jgi:DNA polymerase-3 subunit delta